MNLIFSIVYRGYTITEGAYGFNCDLINCWSAETLESAKDAVDRYIAAKTMA